MKRGGGDYCWLVIDGQIKWAALVVAVAVAVAVRIGCLRSSRK